MTNDSEENRRALKIGFRKILLVRNALQYAKLCGPDDDEENNGRDAAFAVVEALEKQGVVVYVPMPPEPEQIPIIPPTLGERLLGGAISLTSRAAVAASKRSPWSLLRARKTSRSQT